MTSRIRVSLSAGELEVEGSEEFVGKYAETLDIILQQLREGKTPTRPSSETTPAAAAVQPATQRSPEQFGEALHAFSNSATDTDRMLLAGSFAQAGSADATFATGEATQLLVEQGIRPSNPSQCMTNNLKAKRVIRIGKKYRVSKQGEAHLLKLGA